MKRMLLLLIVVTTVATAGFSTQATRAGAVNGMTLNGATGLILVPDARIGWEQAKFGLDLGYGFVWTGGNNVDSLPRFSFSFLKRAEVYGLLHLATAGNEPFRNFVLGGKFQAVKSGGSAVAFGADVEFANNAPSGTNDYVSSKLYASVTYGGDFFSIPSVTSAAFGWQWWNKGKFSSQFVYGMGFSVSLLPAYLKNIVYWISDFSNFSYAVYAPRANTSNRGAFNTGLRIRPFSEGRFNLVFDIVGIDLLDEGSRGLSATISGGVAF